MKRSLKKTASIKITIVGALSLLGSMTFAQDRQSQTSSANQPAASAKSQQLDVSDLENKYWAAKDTDFSVVQNRAYSKEKRFSVSPMYGFLLNDPYSDGTTYGLVGSYFWSERWGAQLQYMKTNSTDNSATKALAPYQGAKPDFNRLLNFYGVGVSWVPIYAKMSVLNSRIIYFDMAITPGIGMSQYEQQMENAAGVVKNAPTLSLDVTQHFFLSNHFALRGEFQNRWYNQDIAKYHLTTSDKLGPDRKLRTDFVHTSILLFGFDLFF